VARDVVHEDFDAFPYPAFGVALGVYAYGTLELHGMVSTLCAVHDRLEGEEFVTDLILSAGDLFLLGVALSCSVVSMLKA
jgi:hypothetical protein